IGRLSDTCTTSRRSPASRVSGSPGSIGKLVAAQPAPRSAAARTRDRSRRRRIAEHNARAVRMMSTAEVERSVQTLRDLRVIDFSTGIAGGYATKLFCDAGADVVKVEPPGGDPLRRFTASGRDLAGRDAPLFQFLAAGKRSVVGVPGDAHVDAPLADAHLVVESFAAHAFGRAR